MSGRSCEKICAAGYKRREAASRVAAQSWWYNIYPERRLLHPLFSPLLRQRSGTLAGADANCVGCVRDIE